jgi:hypothetical protein
MPEALYERIKDYSQKEDLYIAQVITKACKEFIERQVHSKNKKPTS